MSCVIEDKSDWFLLVIYSNAFDVSVISKLHKEGFCSFAADGLGAAAGKNSVDVAVLFCIVGVNVNDKECCGTAGDAAGGATEGATEGASGGVVSGGVVSGGVVSGGEVEGVEDGGIGAVGVVEGEESMRLCKLRIVFSRSLNMLMRACCVGVREVEWRAM